MRYDIKRGNAIVATVHPKGAQWPTAMGADVADMAFTLPVHIKFRINDYVDVYGRRYKINQTPTVEKTEKRKFDYTLHFEAMFYDLTKAQMQGLDPQNQLLEPVFSIMGNAATIVGLIVENANRHSPGWTVGVVDETDYQLFSFSGTSCLAALTQLASTFSTEHWIDGQVIHLQKREQSSGLVFKQGKGNGLYSIKRSNKSNINIFTRLFTRGGSTNLPTGYGSTSLLLPGRATYIQDDAKADDDTGYGLIEKTEVFDKIFPEREGTVSSVVAGPDNWKYFSDSSLDFDVNAQKAPGLDAKITFNTGQLAGYTFTLNEYNAATKTFNINRNEDEKALDVPSDLLRPTVGDKYVLIDIIMPQAYVTDAENRLSAAAWEHYNQGSNPEFLLEYSASCDRIFINQNNVDVQLGSTAVLYDDDMELDVELRITSYKRDLQDPNNYTDVTFSDTIGANEIARQYIQQQRTLRLIEASGLLDVNQLRKNLFLNRLSESNGYLLLSGTKIKAGVADYALDSAKWGGNAFVDYMDQPVKSTSDIRARSLSSTAYVSGAFGAGFKIDENGDATFDNLTVRKQFNVFELVLNKISGTNGALAVSDTIKIDTVTETATGYDCTVDTAENTIAVPFQVNDLVRCQVWNGAGIKYYFAKVTATGNGTFTLDKASKVGAGIPAAGDTVVRFGNTVNTNRQGLLYLTASDTNAPYLDVLDGITNDNLAGKTKVRLGRLDGITDADFGALAGYGMYGENVFLKNGRFKGEITVTGGNAETVTGAQVKANTAQGNAVAVAAADAASKANTAQAAAILAAANNADVKADDVKKYAYGKAYLAGRKLYRDSEFAEGSNGVGLYNNLGNGNVIIDRLPASTLPGIPTTSGNYLRIKNIGAASPGLGGFYFGNNSRPNAKFVARIFAKIPVNYYLSFQTNATGNGATGYWAGPNAGTGDWQEYIYVLFCGKDGDFSSTNFFALNGAENIEWYVASASVYDMSDGEVDYKKLADSAQIAANENQAAQNALVTSLRSLAYQDVVELSKLGSTVVQGGKVVTDLLDANWIQSNVVTAQYVNALQLDASAIKTGVINADRLDVEYIKSNIINASYIQALDIVATTIAAVQGSIGSWTINGSGIEDISGAAYVHAVRNYPNGGKVEATIGGHPDNGIADTSIATSAYGLRVINTRVGSNAINYGIYAKAKGGLINTAIYSDGDVQVINGHVFLEHPFSIVLRDSGGTPRYGIDANLVVDSILYSFTRGVLTSKIQL